MNEIVRDIQTLVECESPSADASANLRSSEVVSALGTHHLGVTPERITRGDFQHLIWRLGDGPRKVLVLGHHDTVWGLGSLKKHPFGVVDGVLRGPGCFDMKTGVVMAFHAVASLPDTSGVTVLITGDEELGSPTSRELIEAEAQGCDAVFVVEASGDGGAIKTQRKGTSLYTVTVHGRAAHAGLEPERGINAAIELAHQVLAIVGIGDEAHGTTVTPTVMTAGSTTNTVPATASVSVDVRMWTTEEQQRVEAEIRGLSAALPGAVIEVTGGVNRPPLGLDASESLFLRAEKIAASLDFPPLASAAVGGASDGNFTAGMGVPTLDGLGAVGGGAHADHQHVIVAEIPHRTQLLAAFIADVLRGADS